MDDLLKKINNLKDEKSVDLSMEEDLSIGIMNLISLEEHFLFTYQKTKKDKYFDLIKETRQIRKRMMEKMLPANEGETWCISKHLLAATMRFVEVGTKYQNTNDDKNAKAAFDDAYKLYNVFWAIRLNLLDVSKTKAKLPELMETKNENKPWSMNDIVTKLVDCCRE